MCVHECTYADPYLPLMTVNFPSICTHTVTRHAKIVNIIKIFLCMLFYMYCSCDSNDELNMVFYLSFETITQAKIIIKENLQ